MLNRFLFPTFSVVRTAASVVLYPVLVVQNYAISPIKNLFSRMKSRQNLELLLEEVKGQYYEVVEKNIELQATLDCYQDIKELLRFKKRYYSQEGILAQVIVKEHSTENHSFLIDRGSLHGTEKDMVVVHKHCLVGKVTHVYPLYSRVILVTDKKCRVAAYCSKTKACGIYVGTNQKGVTRLEHVSHLSKVMEGDLVISSGEGLVFPRGFGLGKIVSAEVDGLYFNTIVEPLINIADIHYCMVLKKGII